MPIRADDPQRGAGDLHGGFRRRLSIALEGQRRGYPDEAFVSDLANLDRITFLGRSDQRKDRRQRKIDIVDRAARPVDDFGRE